MWKPNEPVEEDVSDLPGISLQSNRRRSRRRAWRDGLSDQTVVKTLEDTRSYRAFERALIGSIDPRSVIELELVHRLASLLWRLRRASAIETGLFEIQGEFLHACWLRSGCGSTQWETLQTPTRANGAQNVHGSNGGYHPPTSDQASPLLSTHPLPQRPSNSRAKRNASSASLTLTRRCLRGWAPMKPGSGGRRQKRFGRLMRSGGRRPLRLGRDFESQLLTTVWDWDRRIGRSD
jgi:hypothetical protein